jgi:ribosomal protein S18 acetylase RimI-like enzyme
MEETRIIEKEREREKDICVAFICEEFFMKIRSYRMADAAVLAGLYRAVYPEKGRTAAEFRERMRGVVRSGGRVWVVEQGGQAVGYAAVIGPAVQRQGLGSGLWRQVLAELKGSEVRQVSYPVEEMESPAALFLGRHGFVVEHEEWRMGLENLEGLPLVALPAGCEIRRYGRREAIGLFRRLYRESFGAHPWFQDYASDEEVVGELEAVGGTAADLLFLVCDEEGNSGELRGTCPPKAEGGNSGELKIVGFVWIRQQEEGVGEIEPIGIVPAWQGKGYGRGLLLAALAELRRRGAREARLGVWATNTVAVGLYERVGFRPVGKVRYLAYYL